MSTLSASPSYLSTPPQAHFHRTPYYSLSSPLTLSFPLHTTTFSQRACFSLAADGSDLLRKPAAQPEIKEEESCEPESKEAKDGWVDWEDQILEDTVPLVGFVRMILHSGKYQIGDRLAPEHERTIVERLLPYHPESEKKIGCGIDYIKVGYHPDFDSSKCLFIVRKDGETVDFSYWKCIKGLIRKNYPLYADSFIVRHFRHRRQSG